MSAPWLRLGMTPGEIIKAQLAYRKSRDAAMYAELDHIDALPPEEQRAHWARVDANPRWKRAWWLPEPTDRAKLPRPTRRAVAERHGALRDGDFAVRCPCGAHGMIRRRGKTVVMIGVQVDHVFPIARGGTDAIDNLQLLCETCNRRKGAKIAAA